MKFTRRLFLLFSLLVAVFAAKAATLNAKALNMDELMVDTYNHAVNCTKSGMDIEALKDWISFIRWAEEHPDKAGQKRLQTAYIAMASIYFNFQDYESALDFNRRGLQLCQPSDPPSDRVRFFNNMMGCYAELGDFDKAHAYNDSMKLLAKDIGDPAYAYKYEFNCGYIAKKQKRWNQAIAHYFNSLDEIDRGGIDSSRRAYPYSELFSVYDLTDRTDSALIYLLKYKDYADKPYLKKDCYRELMRIYAKLGDSKNSLLSQEEYFRITDSVLNEREFIELRNQFQDHERRKREGQISQLEIMLSRQSLILMIVGTALAFILVVALIIWRQKRRLNQAYADLYERNRELLKAHDELVQERLRLRNQSPAELQRSVGSEATEAPIADPSSLPELSPLLERILYIFDSSDAYLQSDFSLQTLAKMTDSNTKYVSEAINEGLGCNFRALVNEYRIKEAQRRMLDAERYSNVTIQAIAESVGYKSPSNFIAAFRKATGITPSIFMKISKEKGSSNS